jgi:catalase
MRFDGNFGSAPNYEPNSFGGPKEDPAYKEIPIALDGKPAARYDHREGNDDYTQPGNLYRLMDEGARQRLIENIAVSLGQTPERIQRVQVSHFYKADPEYGTRVAKALGLDMASIFREAKQELHESVPTD